MYKSLRRLLIRYKRILGLMPRFALLFVFITLPTSCDKETIDSDSISGTYAKAPLPPGPPQLLVSGLESSFGSTIGPGGDLFVTEPAIGRISRVNVKTGEVSTFASGLPTGAGGVWDVAFIGGTGYALVTLVNEEVGGSDTAGIYRIDGPTSWTVIADLGTYSQNNLPDTNGEWDFFLNSGVQFAIQTYRGGFLVTDGHHNRVLHVSLDGEISEFRTFGNIVPTGLALLGNTVYMTEAGPAPHLPETGKVVTFGPDSPTVTEVGAGAPLLVDVEFNLGQTLFALSQGEWAGPNEGDAAMPGTGSLVRVNADGTFTVIADELNLPSSLELIKNTAYIVNLVGEVWIVENVAGPPFGM